MKLLFASLFLACVLSACSKAEEVRSGQAIYAQHCALCHGVSGKGDGPEVPGLTRSPFNFTDKAAMAKRTDDELLQVIREGLFPAMPSWRGAFSPEEEKGLVAYLRKFSE